MPEMITHVPSQEELQKWSADRTTIESPVVPEVERLDTPLETMHRQEMAIDPIGKSIYDPSEIGLPNTGEYAVMAELQMGADESIGTVAVIRQKVENGHTFLLAGLSRDPTGKTTGLKTNGSYMELREDFSAELGRSPDHAVSNENLSFVAGLQLDQDAHISRSHARVTYSKDVILLQDVSSNGSLIRANGRLQDIDTHESKHTTGAEEHARLRGYLLETMGKERFDGRIPISRDTVIDGSDAFVDLRSWIAGDEAIIVDSQKYPEAFDKLRTTYNEMLQKNTKEGMTGELAALKSVFDTVSASMEYDLDFVNKMSANIAASVNKDKRKVSLNYYLDYGKGVCRHMALATAWMGGELARNGILEGKATAEVNQRKKDNAAHEWARYTAKDGTVYILDPAQQYFGRLDESLERHGSWEYFRPGERVRYEVLKQQKTAESGGFAVSSLSQQINAR